MTLGPHEIAAILSSSGLTPDESVLERLSDFLDLLLRWNARTNLTAIRNSEGIVARHFADSLFCAAQIPPSALTLLDFGSGGGFPGIPVALTRPEISVTLAESQGKKASFLREAVRTLGMRAEVWGRRVEEMPPARVFDAVTLRAVDHMQEACRVAAQRVAPGGKMLLFSTEKLEAQHRAAVSDLVWGEPISLPNLDQGLLLTGTRR